ncbi:MAG: hypothetical protein DME05_11260 [Candidatus Rokuibacteriota bacterium]|nr:MAG: hypothetical protein DME05_11260 [Candidatus Rokubacteria bacterium]
MARSGRCSTSRIGPASAAGRCASRSGSRTCWRARPTRSPTRGSSFAPSGSATSRRCGGRAPASRPTSARWPAPARRSNRPPPSAARPLYRRLLGLALEHYDVAWSYTLAIPKLEWRMRLACAWPLLIGLATLAELAAHPNPLGAGAPIKISRRAVRALLAQSALTAFSNRALTAQAARVRARIAV